MSIQELLAEAEALASVQGENVEYDRALVELVATFIPGDPDSARTHVAASILAPGSPLLGKW